MRRALEASGRLIVLCGLVVGPAGAFAQAPAQDAEAGEQPPQVVDLQSLIAEALAKSAGLQAKRRAYEAARARAMVAWLPDDPELGVDVEGQPDLLQLNGRADREYMVSQMLPFPTKLFLRGQIAMQDAAIAYQQFKGEERSVIWHIEEPYYDLYLTKKTVMALEEIRGLLNKVASVVQVRYESNAASQQDLLKIQLELSKIQIELFNVRQAEHIAEAHFSHILGQSLETRYRLPGERLSLPLSLPREALEPLALQTRPELKVFEIGIRRAKANRLLAAMRWLPDLTGRIEARQFRGEGGIREYDSFIGVTVPVWSLVRGAGGEWKGATRELQAAEAMSQSMKNEVLLSVHEAHAKVQSAEHAMRVYEQSIIPQAKQQVEVAFAAYEAGRADFLDLIDSQRTLKDAHIAHYKVQAEHEHGLSELRLAIGGPISQDGPQPGGAP